MLGLPENKVRVIAPDVGGGFGGKNRIMPEDIAVAAIAMKVGHPVRWIEDRREHLLASVHARDHYLRSHDFAPTGTARCSASKATSTSTPAPTRCGRPASFMEASMASRNLTGPYRIRHLQLNTYTVATNKAPMGPYRGVARPGACFAIERLVDEVARELGREPFDLRRQNIVTAAELPYSTAAGMTLDTGDYVASLDIARDMINLPAIRERQAQGEPDGRAIGVGFAFYTEQSGHGTVEWVKRKSRVVPGYEFANARMLPDGSVIIHVGVQNHGQGHETTLAQIAAHELGIDPGADLGPLRRHRDLALRFRHLRARARSCSPAARWRSACRDAGREDPAHRRTSAADRRGRNPHRGRRGARPLRQRQLYRDRLCGQRPPGPPAGRHGAAARHHRRPMSRRKPAACSPTAPMPWWSRSSPTPASSNSSTTSSRKTAAP